MVQAAVLTGDLVGSTKAKPEATDDAIDHISAVAAQLKQYATSKDPGLPLPCRFSSSVGFARLANSKPECPSD
jgi:hypothetical protein